MINPNPDTQSYNEVGLLVHNDVFSLSEIEHIKQMIDSYVQEGHNGIIFERDSEVIRGAHGCHLYDPFFTDLVTDHRLATFPVNALGGDVYVHQFKINFKFALDGARWPWHQDFVYWQREDGMPAPRAISAAIFLDDVTEFNGPLTFIRGSHVNAELNQTLQHDEDACWRSTVGEILKYELDRDVLKEICEDHDMLFAPKAKAGSVLFFHPLIAHSSASSISFGDRKMVIITYNRTNNTPNPKNMKRPEFMGNKNFTAVKIKS
jgi:ectoine hydroxylase-related dioxygenase (phytanoyl-CoA dioxygenase family)